MRATSEGGLDADESARRRAARARAECFGSVLERELRRRSLLRGMGAAGAALVLAPALAGAPVRRASASAAGATLGFESVAPGNAPDVVLPPGYVYDVVLRWGDPLFPGAPEHDVERQSPEAQARQVGFNADLVLWFPLPQLWMRAPLIRDLLLSVRFPALKRSASRRAILAVNHEYTSGRDMFPEYDASAPSAAQVLTEIEAHGLTLAEIQLRDSRWRLERDSAFNRRITGSTPMQIRGPLRGHPALRTRDDPAGTEVLGCLNCCAGGFTPWGTLLTCEENFDQYFAGFDREDPRHALSRRIPARPGETPRKWERFVPRFDLSEHPNEYHRFGYVVEIDPYAPDEPPRKRTALGRFKHEGAQTRLARDGRVAVYSGDDAPFEYVYKFVSEGRYRRMDREHDKALLDSGTLYAARFDVGSEEGDERGSGVWLPLVWKAGGPLEQAGFRSQAEVLLNTRGAADALGATPMDRPEDIEIHPESGRVYVALTNNRERVSANEANPRVPNAHGHILEIAERGDDAGATRFRWNVFVKCGDPGQPEHGARFGNLPDPVAAGVSPISCPDNLAFDAGGHLWIATDGQFAGGEAGFGQNDGVFAVPVEGEERGRLRQFLSGVPGAEICGPEFSGDGLTFFCAIQHPHAGRAFEQHWPPGETRVSRPGVIAVRHERGLPVGS